MRIRRMSVVLWLLRGAALLISFTNELMAASATLAWGLQHVRASGPIGLRTMAFITSTAGRVLLLVVTLLLLQHAGKDASGRSTLTSVTAWGVRSGWRAVRRRLIPTTANARGRDSTLAEADPKPPRQSSRPVSALRQATSPAMPAWDGNTSIAITVSTRPPSDEGS